MRKVFILLATLGIKMRNYLQGSLIVSRLKTIMQMKIMREVSLIMDSLDTNMFFVGGFAYDIIVGKLTRSHEDIDVAANNLDKETIISTFEENGFRLLNKRNGSAWAFKQGVKIDILFWNEIDENTMEFREKQVVRMPKEFFTYNLLSFENAMYRVACFEYFSCVRPFTKKDSSKLFLSNLKTAQPISCHQSEETITNEIMVYNYEKSSIK